MSGIGDSLVIASILLGFFVVFVFYNSLFTPINNAVTSLNNTLQSAGYQNQANVMNNSWVFYLLAVPIILMLFAISIMIGKIKNTKTSF